MLDRDLPTVDWSALEVWRGNPFLTPRQAAALITELHCFADLYLADWIRNGTEPLHEIPPFDQLDRRIMFHVGENRAWAAEAAARCYAVAEQIEAGTLPHESVACLFDELLVLAACAVAEETFHDQIELYAEIPSRESLWSEGDDEEGDDWIGDDDWEQLSEWLVDSSNWDAHALLGPPGGQSPIVREALSEHHPFTWFDLPEGRSAPAESSDPN